MTTTSRPEKSDRVSEEDPPSEHRRLRVVFVAWRDLANPRAGGSELLIDRLARGLVERGHEVTMMCGGPVARRPYRVVPCGGTYSQYLRAPFTYRRELRDCDLLVEVCNGMPYLAPLWCDRPVLCLVNHVHTDLWQTRLPPPLSTAGRFAERSLMPYTHRRNLFIAVSDSTADALAGIGVDRSRIRILFNGVERPATVEPEDDEPLFLSLGRLTAYKRVDLLLRLWERVRPVVGGRLVVAGDGPEHRNLAAIAGPAVQLLGRVSEADKRRLLGRAWLLLHPALVEGWGLVVNEAAIHRTPTIAFDAPGLRDSVVHGETGLLADGPGAFASAWVTLALAERLRHRMGAAAHRRASNFTWAASVERFLTIAYEAVGRRAESHG
jgi:glycosyltransferase involved in cell wall biosynthesis